MAEQALAAGRAWRHSRGDCASGTGCASIVLWGPDERELADQVVPNRGDAAMLAPQTSIADVAALARGAR